ncbi:hypothetical protein IM53_019365 [Xanthomonas phaseoli pv. dieffenbachiae]|uniref:Uncharacterized protein n=1 Tax=Xanthomonas phaseoli pv. dieffenbachiae TaxID=92828 RepID=A0A1V9GV05_9XANT|nr:hypothetical protein IM53_019365 [Xanthomonas phaseoli pv. dieffenbachiae]
MIEEMRELGATVALLLRAGEGVGRGHGEGTWEATCRFIPKARGDAFGIAGGDTSARRPLRGTFSRAREKGRMQPLIRLPEHAPLPRAGEGLG